MQLLKWFAVPVLVLAVAATLAVAGCFDATSVSVAFAISGLTSLYLWRQATYRLSGSIKNIDHEQLTSQSRRIFHTIIAITFTSYYLLMLAALIILFSAPAARTLSGSVVAFTLMMWSPIVKYGVMNVLTHHLLLEGCPTRHGREAEAPSA